MCKSFFVLYNYTLYIYLIAKEIKRYKKRLGSISIFHHEVIYNEVTEQMNNMYNYEKAFWYIVHTVLYVVLFITLDQYFVW